MDAQKIRCEARNNLLRLVVFPPSTGRFYLVCVLVMAFLDTRTSCSLKLEYQKVVNNQAAIVEFSPNDVQGLVAEIMADLTLGF